MERKKGIKAIGKIYEFTIPQEYLPLKSQG